MVPLCGPTAAPAGVQQLDLPPILPLHISQLVAAPAGTAGVPAGGEGLWGLPPLTGGAGAPAGAAAAAASLPRIVLSQQARPHAVPVLPACATSGSVPASFPTLTPDAAAAGRFDIVPGPDEAAAALRGAVVPSASPSSSAAAAKILEVEAKVRQVEAKWGPLSLRTGRAYFLLHHACRHTAAAALFWRKGEEALRR